MSRLGKLGSSGKDISGRLERRDRGCCIVGTLYVTQPSSWKMAWLRTAFDEAMSLYSSLDVSNPDNQVASRFSGSSPPA